MNVFNTKQHEVVGKLPEIITSSREDLEDVPQFLQSSPEFILKNSENDNMTNKALNFLHENLMPSMDDFVNLRVDTKIHMLKPDWYPCIPGWHCDFVARDEENNILPNPEDDGIRHWLICSGGPTTQFVNDEFVELEDASSWQSVDQQMNKKIHHGEVDLVQYDAGSVIEFNSRELHRGMPARESCWRWFFRATLFPEGHPERGNFINTIRKQQQVYLELSTGW